VYARQQPKVDRADDLLLCRLIDEEYTRHPYYGSRRMAVYLRNQGYSVNRKRIQRLMRQLGLAGMALAPWILTLAPNLNGEIGVYSSCKKLSLPPVTITHV
jgi:transposase InsO family protein